MQDIKFVTPDGQAVYNSLFKPFRAPASETFLPMRTAFVYDLEEQDSNTDVPTTLRRSKEDCPPVRSLLSCPAAELMYVPVCVCVHSCGRGVLLYACGFI